MLLSASNDVTFMPMPLEYSPSSHRRSQESLLTLISSSSISTNSVSGRRRRFSKSPSSGASSHSSLTDCSFGVVGARNHFYRRSTRHLSVRTPATASSSSNPAVADATAEGSSFLQLNVKPMSFEVPCIDADTSLVGREWVFHELMEILVRPTSENGMKGAVIYGATGTGKTSVLQQLASLSPFYQQDAHLYANFCDSPLQTNVSTDSGFASSSRQNLQSNGCPSSTAAGGSSWCRDVARSVIGYHFCQIEDYTSCFLPEFLYSICAMVAHSPQMSAYRDYLAVDKQLLKRFSIAEFLLDAEGTFRALFTDPLNCLRRCGKLPPAGASSERNFLLLVDALDEAEFHRLDGANDSISSFLVKHATELLPSWLKLVVSVKASSLDTLKGLPLHKINFDSVMLEERLYVDCRSYIEFRIRTSDNIQANISSGITSSKLFTPMDNSCPLSRFIEYLSNSSKASFLYLRLLLNLVDQNYVVVKGSNYNVLPVNLSEVLTLMLNLRFTTERAFLDVMPIFSTMLASLCPLTGNEIYEILNAGRINSFIPWEVFSQRMASLQDFVVMRQDQRYIFFHPAFREWLVKQEETTNARFKCDSRLGHALIALWLTRLPKRRLSSRQVQDLGHYILKAHIYKFVSASSENPNFVKDCQLFWVQHNAENIKSALCTDRNVFYPNSKVSRLLLLAGSSPNVRTSYYNNASLLSVAARQGLHDFATLLLDFGADVHQADDCGATPLIHAAIGGHLDLMQFFHLHGAQIDTVDNNRKCALVYAAEHGHVKVVSFLLQCDWPHCKERVGGERSGRFSRQQYIQQAFVAAAAAGYNQVCKFLLEFCDVRIDDPDPVTGETALSVSCRNGNKEVVFFLLDAGASVAYGKSSKPTPPLITAVESGYWEIVSSILARGLNVNGEQNEQLQTAVIVAAKNGHIGVLELLLSRDADLNATDIEGRTALSWACIGDCYSCARLLLERGANAQVYDRQGCYPIHFAAQYGSKQLIRLLIEHNAALECKNMKEYRPLEVALETGNVDAAQRLLRRGAKLGRLTWQLVVNKPHFLIMLLEKLLQDANFLYRNHRVSDALCRLQYALKNIPSDTGADLNLLSKFLNIRYHLFLGVARCKKKCNELSEAVQFATRAIDLDGAQVDGYYFRARCYYDCKNWIAARADLAAVLKLCPNHKEALHSLSRLKQYLKSDEVTTAAATDNGPKYSLLCKSQPATAVVATANTELHSNPNSNSVHTALHGKNNWEQSSCDSGNAPDIDIVDNVNSQCRRPLLNWSYSGKLQA